MISDEVVLKELLKFKMPEVEKLMDEIEIKMAKLPSDNQLQKLKSIVLSRDIENIKNYLKKREKISGSENWVNKIFSHNLDFKDIILKKVIEPLENTDRINLDSMLWGIDIPEFMVRTRLANLDIGIGKHRLLILREVLTKMVNKIIMKRKLNQHGIGIKF